VGFAVVAGGVCAGGGVVGGVCARALPATKTAKKANVIVCLLMSGLYLNLSKGNDNVERAAEASAGPSGGAFRNPGKLTCMRRVPFSRTFLKKSSFVRGFAALLLVAGSTACDDPGPTEPTDPTPEAPTFTETFSGVLSRNGALTFPFEALAKGTATATLASIQPDNTIALGMAMGTWNGTTCQSIITNDNAIEFTQISGSIGSAGLLCLRVYDIGRVATSTKFALTVVHP
jgi:hypothetical protein